MSFKWAIGVYRTYVDADGARYVGQFQSGSFHREGTYSWPNGDVYIGRFKANRMDGAGRLERASGDRPRGERSFQDRPREGRPYGLPPGHYLPAHYGLPAVPVP